MAYRFRIRRCVSRRALWALTSGAPPTDGTLAKSQGNVITLTFTTPIALTGAAPLSIVPLAGGDDVAGQFTYSVEADGVTLRAVENGAVLTNQTWYRIEPTAEFVVANFTLDVCMLIGDANGDRQVMALDLGMAWAQNGQSVPAKP